MQLLCRRLRLQADCIKAVLDSQRFAQLDAGDLGDRIPLIGGLQRSGEQRLFPDRQLGELRVDAAAAQKQQPPHPRAPGSFDHMGLDLQVLQQKVGRVAAIGLNTAQLGGGEHYQCGLVLGEPGFHRRAIEQVELRAAGGEELVVASAPEGAADGAAGHAAVDRHEDAVGGGDQRGHGTHLQAKIPTSGEP